MDDERNRWVDIAAEQEIGERPLVVKRGRTQLVVMRDGEGCVRALDNRCPHEGYPLSQGQVRGCQLTCAWHNFKFDLRDGACLKGDEAMTVYPVRVVEGRVQVDVTPRPRAGAVEEGMERLREGLRERRLGQMARQIVRLLDLGVAPQDLAMEAACFDAERAQWGCSHALALASETIAMLPRFTGDGGEAALPLMQVFDMASEACVRRDPHPIEPAIDPGADPAAAAEALAAAVENEDGRRAQGLLRGALQRGFGRAEIEPMFFAAICRHHLAFGHPLIYQGTVFDLLDRVGWSYAPRLLPGHLRGIVGATREDTLPRWRSVMARLHAWEAEEAPAADVWAAASTTGRAAELPSAERADWYRALVDGSRDEAFDAICGAIVEGHPPAAIADVIAAAAAARLLRFDRRHQWDVGVQEGWLDVTHTLTHAVAARLAVQRYRGPYSLRPLLFAARFVHNAGALDRAEPEAEPTLDVEPDAVAVDDIVAAIHRHEPQHAVALARAYLDAHGVDEPLRRAIADLPLSDRYTRPIIVAHAIKTGRAAVELSDRLAGTPWAHDPVLAHIRFAASVERERPVAQLVHEARRLVVEGKVPRALT